MNAVPSSLPRLQAVFSLTTRPAACTGSCVAGQRASGVRRAGTTQPGGGVLDAFFVGAADWRRRSRRARPPRGSRLPLLAWFWSAYLLATTPGVNALTLGRLLALSSRETAWTILDRLRGAMISTDLPPLSGTVEADEMAPGGFAPG